MFASLQKAQNLSKNLQVFASIGDASVPTSKD